MLFFSSFILSFSAFLFPFSRIALYRLHHLSLFLCRCKQNIMFTYSVILVNKDLSVVSLLVCICLSFFLDLSLSLFLSLSGFVNLHVFVVVSLFLCTCFSLCMSKCICVWMYKLKSFLFFQGFSWQQSPPRSANCNMTLFSGRHVAIFSAQLSVELKPGRHICQLHVIIYIIYDCTPLI